MKIGILTFHMGHNYGGVLQCYALQQLLTNYGHEVEIIDYRPRYGYTLRSLVGKLHSVHSPKVLYHLLCEKVKFKTLTAAEIKIRHLYLMNFDINIFICPHVCILVQLVNMLMFIMMQ